MKFVLHPEQLAGLEAVARWLRFAEEAAERARQEAAGEEMQLRRVTELSVIAQMRHLQTHPSVAARLSAGALDIHGSIYEIETGRITAYDPVLQRFVPWP